MSGELPTTAVLHRNPKLTAVELDGDTVMMDSESGRYFALTGVGGFIWEQLETSLSSNEVMAALAQHFDLSSNPNAQDEIGTFLSQLVENGLILVGDRA